MTHCTDDYELVNLILDRIENQGPVLVERDLLDQIGDGAWDYLFPRVSVTVHNKHMALAQPTQKIDTVVELTHDPPEQNQ